LTAGCFAARPIVARAVTLAEERQRMHMLLANELATWF